MDFVSEPAPFAAARELAVVSACLLIDVGHDDECFDIDMNLVMDVTLSRLHMMQVSAWNSLWRSLYNAAGFRRRKSDVIEILGTFLN